ncbi:MAG: sensor histidine kinase [Sphingobium sp.]
MMRALTPGWNRSLSLRLLLFAGAMIGLALGAAWLALGLLFERHLDRQLQTELERNGIALIAALQLTPDGRPTLTRALPDPRFDRPGSGLYWRASAPAGELRSRSLWDGKMPPPAKAAATGWTAFQARGPFEDRILVIARKVRLARTGPAILIEVAADRQPVTDARAAFGTESGLFLFLLWFALATAAWVQVRLGLRPLGAVSRELKAMTGKVGTRLAESDHPAEIRPLTRAINDFADQRSMDVAKARERARDLAHALKTPITALRMQIERLDATHRQEMAHSLSLLAGAVESELARSGEMATGQGAMAAKVVDRLLAVVSRTPDGARLDLHNRLTPDLVIPMGDEAALESLGALIDNAARHARATVEISGGSDDAGCWMAICDDGEGIAEALRPIALGRGIRLDERNARHGLGLSIAQAFVEASGGRFSLHTAPIGGLCVHIGWDGKQDGSADAPLTPPT